MHIGDIFAPSRLVCALAATALLPAFGQTYKFTSFQYPNAQTTIFTGIDDTNRIVGWSNIGAGTQGFFLTAAGSLSTLNLPGWDTVIPKSINRLGGVVGTVYNSSTGALALFQDNVQGDTAVPQLLINQDWTGINASFNTVGNFTSPDGQTAVYADIAGNYHTLLPQPKCTYTHDPAINDNNVVVGACITPSLQSILFTWNNGRFTYLTTPTNIPYIQATGISKAGEIVGWYDDTSGFAHGFVIKAGVFTTVDYPAAGAYNTQIYGVNAAGRIVGSFYGPNLMAFSAISQ